MGLVVHWYDFVCFGIVGVAFLGSLLVMYCRRRGPVARAGGSLYESLLVGGGSECDGVSPRAGEHVNSCQLWKSCWRGFQHPAWLLGIRFLSFVILSGILALDILDYDASIFVYYTEWTFTLVIIYFAIASIVSAQGCVVYYSKSKTKRPADPRTPNGKRDVERTAAITAYRERLEYRGSSIILQPQNAQGHATLLILQTQGFWGYLMQVVYQTCAGAVLLTDVIFWCVIVPFLPNVHLQPSLLMGCMHTLNAAFLLLDTSINSLPFPWFRLAYFVLWSCCYVIFQWVIHACGFTWWPYPFLELSTPWAPLWYFCLAVIHIPCYGFYWLVVSAKNSVLARLFPNSFVKY